MWGVCHRCTRPRAFRVACCRHKTTPKPTPAPSLFHHLCCPFTRLPITCLPHSIHSESSHLSSSSISIQTPPLSLHTVLAQSTGRAPSPFQGPPDLLRSVVDHTTLSDARASSSYLGGCPSRTSLPPGSAPCTSLPRDFSGMGISATHLNSSFISTTNFKPHHPFLTSCFTFFPGKWCSYFPQ